MTRILPFLPLICSVALAQPVPHTVTPQVALKHSPYDAPISISFISSSNAVSYNIYEGTEAGIYTNEIQTTGVLAVSNLLRGTRYYFAASAVNAQGYRSGLSEPVSFLAVSNVATWFLIFSNGVEVIAADCTNAIQEWSIPKSWTRQRSNDVEVIP